MLATTGGQLLDHSVVLRLWERWPVIVGITHHHPQLDRLGDRSPIGTLDHDADQELTKEKDQRRLNRHLNAAQLCSGCSDTWVNFIGSSYTLTDETAIIERVARQHTLYYNNI